MAREAEPSTSHEGEEVPRMVLPAQFGPTEVMLVPEDGSLPNEVDVPHQERGKDAEGEQPTVSSPAEHQPERNATPAERSSERAEWLEQLAARYREML